MQDVHNLVARLRRESYAFPTIEERIHAILEDFASQKGNLTRVYANEEVRSARRMGNREVKVQDVMSID
ncbi:hypothetical protein PR003_g3973 [Phytophthora rubi]|uniref:Uncharacterized protein n=1 Tax=Phytophthora rubi TaxID=129364 RepID=A0A6A3HID4_9STRA|nr:hypothetical protein PR001_g27349 [Phytophthora rubi]KAE9353252.1 hypothetical protein PR003_g3973 [Phytophthora rubi]